MTMQRRAITAKVARELTQNTEPWLSCDDCFDLTDGCVEALVEHGQAPGTPMRVHLSGCPACLEDVRSLLMLVAEEDGVDPTPLLPLLEQDPRG